MRRGFVLLLAMLGVGCGAQVAASSDAGSRSVRDAGSVETGVVDSGPRDSRSADVASTEAAAQLPACTWSVPSVPPNDGPVKASANRTLLLCGQGNVNNFACVSASQTECPVDGDPVCFQQCSPCAMMCAPTEYGVGLGMPQFSQPPPGGYPYQTPVLPSGCHEAPGMVPDVNIFWQFYCCPCH